MKKIELCDKIGRPVWSGSAGDLVDDMVGQIETIDASNVERFSWSLACLADNDLTGFEHNLSIAIGYPDLIVNVDGKCGPFADIPELDY